MKQPVQRGDDLRGEAVAGLVCRSCGCRRFRVIYLKRLPGALRRRRECRHCGKRVATKERISE